jgi:hypothetical protein
MMPYDSYRLYQVERAKSPAEIRHADEQAGRLASAASSLVRGITRPWRARRRPVRPRRATCPPSLTSPPVLAPNEDEGAPLIRQGQVAAAGAPAKAISLIIRQRCRPGLPP